MTNLELLNDSELIFECYPDDISIIYPGVMVLNFDLTAIDGINANIEVELSGDGNTLNKGIMRELDEYGNVIDEVIIDEKNFANIYYTGCIYE